MLRKDIRLSSASTKGVYSPGSDGGEQIRPTPVEREFRYEDPSEQLHVRFIVENI